MLAADLLVTNANLITLDPWRSRAAAMAVRGGRVVFVGDAPEAARLAGPETRRLDLAGRTVTPGLIDSHIHLLWYGSQLLKQADLVGCGDIDEMLGRLSALAGRVGEGWLQGHGFDQ